MVSENFEFIVHEQLGHNHVFMKKSPFVNVDAEPWKITEWPHWI